MENNKNKKDQYPKLTDEDKRWKHQDEFDASAMQPNSGNDSISSSGDLDFEKNELDKQEESQKNYRDQNQ